MRPRVIALSPLPRSGVGQGELDPKGMHDDRPCRCLADLLIEVAGEGRLGFIQLGSRPSSLKRRYSASCVRDQKFICAIAAPLGTAGFSPSVFASCQWLGCSSFKMFLAVLQFKFSMLKPNHGSKPLQWKLQLN